MKLGFLTACFPQQRLSDIAGWAAASGFAALEVAAWPGGSDRPFTATHLDVARLTSADVARVTELFARHGLQLSSIAYYDNNLHPDAEQRKQVNEHVQSCIDAAARLQCPTVGTFIGRDPTMTVSENLRAAAEVFRPLVEHANARGVKIVIENCVMEGWHPDGYPGNLAYSPELWEWMFSLGLYLNFDPSHLVWMGIDPLAVVAPYAARIAHAQAKDIQIFADRRNRYGYPGKAVQRNDPWDVGWWRYRVPGLGEINWPRLLDILQENGFDGVVSVEHEDPVWTGSEERIKRGLCIARNTLAPLINP